MYTIIVTGATGGIGKLIVKKLIKRGYIVFATDVKKENLNELKNEFLENKENLFIELLDVRKPELWEKLIDKAQKQKFPLYSVIHSAGVLLPGYIKDSETKDIDFHIDINAKGSIIGSQILSKYFSKEKKGHIIHIASLAGISPVPGIALYSASKFAIRGFSLALAMELKDSNVFVTCICPDAVDTPMLDLQKDYEEAAITFSGKQALSAEEVAETVIQVLGKDIIEITLPKSRGIQAKFASFFPSLASKLLSVYKKKGLKNQKEYKQKS